MYRYVEKAVRPRRDEKDQMVDRRIILGTPEMLCSWLPWLRGEFATMYRPYAYMSLRCFTYFTAERRIIHHYTSETPTIVLKRGVRIPRHESFRTAKFSFE
jgi:hypothetical protein